MQNEFCQRENIKAFVVLIETGITARMLSRLRPYLPIYALTRNKDVADQLCLVWGVIPIYYNFGSSIYNTKESAYIKQIINIVKKEVCFKKGDKVIMIYGEDWGTLGKTSVIRIQEVI